MYHLRSSEHCNFPRAIIRWRDLDDIASDDVDPFEAVQDRLQLPRRPAADFCRAGALVVLQLAQEIVILIRIVK